MNRKFIFYDKIFRKIYYNEGSNNLMNTGWGDSNIIIYKGAHSSIEFMIIDHDRKPVVLKGRSVFIRFIDFQTRRKILEKEMIIVDPYKGRVKLVLSPNDVMDWNEGVIEYYVLIAEQDNDEIYYLYNDFAQGATGYIILKGTSVPREPTPQRLIGFKPDNFNNETVFISNIFKGPLMLGYSQPLTTISMILENFSGKIYFQGTLDPTVPIYNSSWITIQLKPGYDYLDFNNQSGNFAYNVIGNYTYFRFYYIPINNEGKISKILLL
ncbi:MAG: hypothetical protein QXF12_04160 [Candidatus Aenigmatarchaeota archaeon]